jgi:hypothetical protein
MIDESLELDMHQVSFNDGPDLGLMEKASVFIGSPEMIKIKLSSSWPLVTGAETSKKRDKNQSLVESFIKASVNAMELPAQYY